MVDRCDMFDVADIWDKGVMPFGMILKSGKGGLK
jgi:hypothetical protein